MRAEHTMAISGGITNRIRKYFYITIPKRGKGVRRNGRKMGREDGGKRVSGEERGGSGRRVSHEASKIRR